MMKPSRSISISVFISVLIIVLAVICHLLFKEIELVWPYFLLPYVVFLVIYIVYSVKNKLSDTAGHIYHVLILIPVLSGLTMSLAWMVKINFWGEQLSSLF